MARLAQVVVVVVVAARQDDLLMQTEMGGCAQVMRSPSFGIITIIFCFFLLLLTAVEPLSCILSSYFPALLHRQYPV